MSNIQHLKIKNLGPIKNCELDLTKMMILDGPQAAGKSTVAKAIFFFRTVKDSLLELFFSPRNWSDPVIVQSAQYVLMQKLRRIFDFNLWSNDTFLSFEYNPEVKIEITAGKSAIKNSVQTFDGHLIKFSAAIKNWLLEQTKKDNGIKNQAIIKKSLENLFEDNQEIIYIPAGRNMLSTLSSALAYFLFKFDDREKNLIDYCTTDYIERVARIKTLFKINDKQEYPAFVHIDNNNFNPEYIMHIHEKMGRILQGRYKYNGIEEILDIGNQNVKIQFASSGQQEVLWILNLIYYYLMSQKPACFIIEEPEAHLYPNSQKEITEYITLALSEKNNCIITTHSPYILGTLSNLLDARRMMDEGFNISHLLEQENLTSAQLLKRKDFSAYFVKDGKLKDAIDTENGLIRNELIDGASDKINGFADDLMYLEWEGKNNVGE